MTTGIYQSAKVVATATMYSHNGTVYYASLCEHNGKYTATLDVELDSGEISMLCAVRYDNRAAAMAGYQHFIEEYSA